MHAYKQTNAKQTNNIKYKMPLWPLSTASIDGLFDNHVGRYLFRVKSHHCNEAMMKLTLINIKISYCVTENRVLREENSMSTGKKNSIYLKLFPRSKM